MPSQPPPLTQQPRSPQPAKVWQSFEFWLAVVQAVATAIAGICLLYQVWSS